MEIDKQKRIKKEKNKLMKIFRDAQTDKSTLNYIEASVNNLAWMAVALADLREEINKHGYIEIYNNGGGQSGTKDSVNVKAYNSLIKNYNSLLKTISAFLPESDKKESKSELADFLLGNDKK
jgi:alanine racemase